MNQIRGKKIKIIRYNDPMRRVKEGLIGTVDNVDVWGRLYVVLENGRSIIVNERCGDQYEIIGD